MATKSALRITNLVQTDALTTVEEQLFHLDYLGRFINLTNDEYRLPDYSAGEEELVLLWPRNLYEVAIPEDYDPISDPDNIKYLDEHETELNPDFIEPGYTPEIEDPAHPGTMIPNPDYNPKRDYTNPLFDTPNPKFIWKEVELGGQSIEVEDIKEEEHEKWLLPEYEGFMLYQYKDQGCPEFPSNKGFFWLTDLEELKWCQPGEFRVYGYENAVSGPTYQCFVSGDQGALTEDQIKDLINAGYDFAKTHGLDTHFNKSVDFYTSDVITLNTHEAGPGWVHAMYNITSTSEDDKWEIHDYDVADIESNMALGTVFPVSSFTPGQAVVNEEDLELLEHLLADNDRMNKVALLAYTDMDVNYALTKPYLKAWYEVTQIDNPDYDPTEEESEENPKYLYIWSFVNDEDKIEHLLNRERNDMLNHLSVTTSSRKTYYSAAVYPAGTPGHEDDTTRGGISYNETLSEALGKEVYDMTITAELPIMDSTCHRFIFDKFPTASEADTICSGIGSYLVVYKLREATTEEPEPTPDFTKDTPLRTLFSREEYLTYLDKGIDFESTDHDGPASNEYLVGVTDSIYARAVEGETRIVIYCGEAEDYDKHDRAKTFRKHEVKLMVKGFQKNAETDSIKFSDNDPRYFESPKGVFLSSVNGGFKEVLEDTFELKLEQKNTGTTASPVYDPFNYILTFFSSVVVDYDAIPYGPAHIRFMDVTDNKQGKEELADNLQISETGIYRPNYEGIQFVDLYRDENGKNTIESMQYALETALLNTYTNKNRLDKVVHDLMTNIKYVPDDTIVFKSMRQFLLYQAGKEAGGFSTDEFHKLIVETDATDASNVELVVPNNYLVFYKGELYQNRSGIEQTVRLVYGGGRINPDYFPMGDPLNIPGGTRGDESPAVAPYYSALWGTDHPEYDPDTLPTITNKHQSVVTGEYFYVLDWPNPIDLNSMAENPKWWKISIEEYLNVYTDYTACSWDDSVFMSTAEVMNEGPLEPFYSNTTLHQLFTKDAVAWEEDPITHETFLHIQDKQDTYKRFWYDADGVEHEVEKDPTTHEDIIPEEAVSVKATGYKSEFDFQNDIWRLTYTVPINHEVHGKAIYARVDSNLSQDYIKNDFVFSVVPKCDAGSEKINGQIVHSKGSVNCRPVTGMGCFSYGNITSVIYDPFQGSRIYDEEGELAVEYFEGTLTYVFEIYIDKQMMSVCDNTIENYWKYFSDAAKDACCDAVHKLILTFADYTVSAHNIKQWFGSYQLNKGWDFYGSTAEIRYDDKEVMLNLELKFTPCDPSVPKEIEDPDHPGSMIPNPDYYEYTNIPVKNLPIPMNKFIHLFGHTEFSSFPASVGVTIDNKGNMVLEDNVDNFYLSAYYRYIVSDIDFISLHIPDFSELATSDPEFFNLLKHKIHSIEVIPDI